MMLKCVGCGCEWVSIFKTETFMRGEDKVTSELNPSARRSGVRVTLRCEECGVFTDFNIAEHKGQTLTELTQAKV